MALITSNCVPFRRIKRPMHISILLSMTWACTFIPTLVTYVFFDMPLYKQWYGNNIHNFIEFHPLTNWPSYFCGTAAHRRHKHYHRRVPVLPRKVNLINSAQPCCAGLLLARLFTMDGFVWLHERLLQSFGGAAAVLTIVLTFSFLEAPGFEMGTHKLLIDKGPLAMPVLLVLLSACVEPKPKEIAEAAEAGPPSASLPTRAWRFYSSCFGVDAILSVSSLRVGFA